MCCNSSSCGCEAVTKTSTGSRQPYIVKHGKILPIYWNGRTARWYYVASNRSSHPVGIMDNMYNV